MSPMGEDGGRIGRESDGDAGKRALRETGSRERVALAIRHETPDRAPVDFLATPGIHLENGRRIREERL